MHPADAQHLMAVVSVEGYVRDGSHVITLKGASAQWVVMEELR